MLSDKKSREKLRKGYAFVHINRNHWGAMAIDFKSHQFIFGDSMNNQVNSNAVKTARALMLRFGRIMDKDELRQWEGAEHRIGTMTIGDQRRGGSCGIIAANSIEYDINSTFDCDCETTCYRHCELWSHERSAFHRMRFMGLLADPGVPELDVFSREATGKAPPQVRRESSLLATGFGVTPPQLKRKSSLLDTYRLPPKVGVAPPQARCGSTSFDSDELPPQVRYDLLFQSLANELPPRDDPLLHAKDDPSQQVKRELSPK
ncbi:hypothetical protein BGX21_005536, partial [Mortierella sp. AD011]